MKVAEIHQVEVSASITVDNVPNASNPVTYGQYKALEAYHERVQRLQMAVTSLSNFFRSFGPIDTQYDDKGRWLIASAEGTPHKIEVPVRFKSVLEYQRWVWEYLEEQAVKHGIVMSGYLTFKE